MAIHEERRKVFGAWIRLNQAHTALPSGVKTFEEFDGGRVEVRLGASTVLARAYMVPFPRLADHPKPARSLRARGREELAPPEGGAARAVVEARVTVSETRRVQSFTLRAVGLNPAAGPFTVTALDVSGTHTPLGSFTAGAPMGAGRLSISTARGGSLPGGADWLSGQALEVRDAQDEAVLTGSFPTLLP